MELNDDTIIKVDAAGAADATEGDICFNHHKKSEQAMKHLNTCRAFCREMNGIEIDDRPEWYGTSSKMNKRAKLLKMSTSSPSTASVSSSTEVSSVTRTSSMKDYLLPKMDATTAAKFQQTIVMHYYTTGTSF